MKRERYVLIGKLVYFIIKLIHLTLKIETHYDDEYRKEEQYIYSFWHNKIYTSIVIFDFLEKKVGLISSSKDGEILNEIMKRYGFESVRGSSGKKGIRSLLGVLKMIKQGYNFGTASDGPRGPIFQAKPGMLYIAEKSGLGFVPVGAAYKRKWTLKTWDSLEIPKPFTKMVVYFGKPIRINSENNNEEMIEYVNNEMNNINDKAESILRGGIDD